MHVYVKFKGNLLSLGLLYCIFTWLSLQSCIRYYYTCIRYIKSRGRTLDLLKYHWNMIYWLQKFYLQLKEIFRLNSCLCNAIHTCLSDFKFTSTLPYVPLPMHARVVSFYICIRIKSVAVGFVIFQPEFRVQWKLAARNSSYIIYDQFSIPWLNAIKMLC